MKKLILSAVAIALWASFAPLGTYTVDTKASTLKWTGYHLAKSYEHYGMISLKTGKLTFDKNGITAGEFVIDMNSLTCTDIAEPDRNAKLVGHLKADDFFNVEAFPEARLVIKGSQPLGNGKYKTQADLTIRDVTKPIEFETTVAESGNQIEAVADLRIQRTDFKVMYGWKLENAVLSGEFRLEVKLVGKK